MLQRVQAVLTLALLVAVIVSGVQFYRGQQANETATANMMKILDKLADRGPVVEQTTPKTGDMEVDPSTTEIRVTFNQKMMDGNWLWCYDPDHLVTTGKPRYETDGKTCVLPVQLEPGKEYAISLNTEQFRNFKDSTGRPAVP